MSKARLETKRWWIAVAGVVIQLCLGSVYAWSIFKKPLRSVHGWSETETQGAFMIYAFMFAVSVAIGGALVDRKGPRFVGLLGGVLFGSGLLLAGYADTAGSLLLLYGAYGVIAGLGGGFGYVTPITTLIRWFPDRRGLVTGLAVMGYGFGSFIMGNVGPTFIISYGISATFFLWGSASMVLVVCSVLFLHDPPQGWLPAGADANKSAAALSAPSFTFSQAVWTIQFWILWAMVFIIVTAGLGLISQLSPMAQDVILSQARGPVSEEALKSAAIESGSIVAIAAVFNGIGRLFWAWGSDLMGRKRTFAILFTTEALGCLVLAGSTHIVMFTAVMCFLLACYGGGLSCMPAFAADEFGHAHIGKIYGVIFSACGFAGIAGPYLFAYIKDLTGSFASALYIESALLFLGLILVVTFRSPQRVRQYN